MHRLLFSERNQFAESEIGKKYWNVKGKVTKVSRRIYRELSHMLQFFPSCTEAGNCSRTKSDIYSAIFATTNCDRQKIMNFWTFPSPVARLGAAEF